LAYPLFRSPGHRGCDRALSPGQGAWPATRNPRLALHGWDDCRACFCAFSSSVCFARHSSFDESDACLMTNSLAERLFNLALWLAGAGHFVILFASFQVPFRLGWKQDLAQLRPFNRKILWAQGGATVLTIIAFGTMTLALHQELLRGDRA